MSNVTEGYLEVYLGYDWGFVCEDFYYYYYYYHYYYYNEGNSINDDRIADLACQQIGYAGAVSYEKEYYDQYYTYTANIIPLGCDQTTTVIANCSDSYESPYCSRRWSLVCQTGKFHLIEPNYYSGKFVCVSIGSRGGALGNFPLCILEIIFL